MSFHSTLRRVRRIAAGGAVVVLIASCGGETRSNGEGIFTETAASATSAAPGGFSPLPASAFRVDWKAPESPLRVTAGDQLSLEITVTNRGDVPWPDPASSGGSPHGAGAVRLGHRWWPLSGTEPGVNVGYAETRTDLREALPAGESATLQVELKAPTTPGNYKLEFDLVQELVTWFRAQGAPPLILDVVVEP